MSERPPIRWKVLAVREKSPYLRSVPGRWIIEVEGWTPQSPPVGQSLEVAFFGSCAECDVRDLGSYGPCDDYPSCQEVE